jgi:hypothetical protein
MTNVQTNPSVTHVAFADESCHNVGQFRGVGVVSLGMSSVEPMSADLVDLLTKASCKDFKWQDVKDAKGRFAAKHLVDFALKHAMQGQLRVDTLTWDCQDSRHCIAGRDDIKNLARMYYHLFSQVLRRRWPASSRWLLYPDTNALMNWEVLGQYLAKAGTAAFDARAQTGRPSARGFLQSDFGIEDIIPVSSEDHPFVQLIDVFVGMSVYSRSNYDKLDYLVATKGQQCVMFPPSQNDAPKISKSDLERYDVIYYLNERCKARKLAVSLKSHRGLRTMDPQNPINFWWYKPQHPDDVAPTKSDGPSHSQPQ